MDNVVCNACGAWNGHYGGCEVLIQLTIIRDAQRRLAELNPPEPVCNCCGGVCRNDDPVFNPKHCCYSWGSVCPIHH